MNMEKSIVSAVTEAINAGDVDGEWRFQFYGRTRKDIHAANECLSMCSGNDARHDFYAMWYPEYRKHEAAKQPRFPEVFCSHCGGAFPAADHGYSHCESHKGIARHD